ncbi:polyadenylate-binding protein-interacting protein 1-like isoform X2 [Pyrgilauda ruficollis]|uniref:polyadenylate-binding protein-interacting protein 1-like isoform X2 n=1 Tax=Pyrgilauda ruficollis TaxID=221976 RepID=UPI001B88274D|nr:polyadenylate-binding protein-interacting protein 1-like isoform X2 [Pyrgilauda ruficollis]
MSDSFNRAPGAGRVWSRGGAALSGADASESGGGACPGGSGSHSTVSAEKQHKTGGLLLQQEPLRPPKTAPLSTGNAEHLQQARIPSGSQEKVSVPDSGPEMAESQVAVAPVVTSKLSVKAPEFYPSGYNQNFADSSFEDEYDGYLTLAEYVQDFLNHLAEQPGCFETEIEHFAETVNGWVTADETLQELVELVYQQATSVPNFSYMGARLCSYLSHHLTISTQSGSFRQLLLQRCQTEYENRDEAAKGDETAQKQFHAFVLFLAELYLNLELTGSVLEDAWKEKGKNDMEEMIQRIENVVLDANCSRDVKHMLLKVVELRSSNWGRVHETSPHTKATPENDPNYFMNEPTFYTSDGVPFTAADPDYQEKYQELLEREDLFPNYEENGVALSGPGDQYFHDLDNKMDPEIEEAYEKFCLESEHKIKQ